MKNQHFQIELNQAIVHASCGCYDLPIQPELAPTSPRTRLLLCTNEIPLGGNARKSRHVTGFTFGGAYERGDVPGQQVK